MHKKDRVSGDKTECSVLLLRPMCCPLFDCGVGAVAEVGENIRRVVQERTEFLLRVTTP